MSWVAIRGALEAPPASLVAGRNVRAATLDARVLAATCARGSRRVILTSADGWLFAFGFQLGLGTIARQLSKTHGTALSFENDGKRGVRVCSVYRDGALLREVRHLDGAFVQNGAALGGEPALAQSLDDELVARLARAWGADLERVSWGSPSRVASLPVPTRSIAVALLIVFLLGAFMVRTHLWQSPRDRCRSSCERQWRATYRNTPECRDVELDQCPPLRSAIDACVSECG